MFLLENDINSNFLGHTKEFDTLPSSVGIAKKASLVVLYLFFFLNCIKL